MSYDIVLDKSNFPLDTAIAYAKQYYDKETFDHAMRVMGYVATNAAIPQQYKMPCMALAVMHDLVEDTEFKGKYISNNYEIFRIALEKLTKPKQMSYKDYCRNLSASCSDRHSLENHNAAVLMAYWVKLADMKDHLTLKETLTDKLKEKYLEGLAELL